MDVAINLDLEAVNLENRDINDHIGRSYSDLFPEAPGVIDAIDSTILLEPGITLVHKNLMHYLTLAWYNHFSVILSPDMIFYTVVCEIADAIKTDSDAYRHLFTDSTQKKEIITFANTSALLDLNQVILSKTTKIFFRIRSDSSPFLALSKNIAIDASLFTAEFSTSNLESRLAIQAAFCDAMSPYYYYSRSRCGIPRIKILGTKDDWTTLEKKIYKMATEAFVSAVDPVNSENSSLVKYLQRVIEVVHKIHTETSQEYWAEMYQIEKCRSGHTNFVKGWITKFYRKHYGDDFYNFEPHISSVSYNDNQKEYELRAGLLYSTIEQGTSALDLKFPWHVKQTRINMTLTLIV